MMIIWPSYDKFILKIVAYYVMWWHYKLVNVCTFEPNWCNNKEDLSDRDNIFFDLAHPFFTKICSPNHLHYKADL